MDRDLGEGVAGPSESISVATGLAGVRGAAVTATCLLQLLLGLLGVGRSLKVARSGLQTIRVAVRLLLLLLTLATS